MTYPLARLVSGPDPSASVRYDFNDEDVVAPRRVSADFSLGTPALLTAPDAVSPAYGFRSISMGHVIRGSKSDALAALAVLSRELLRSSSWFLFQVDAFTRPVWFKIYSTSPEALSFEQVYVDTATGDPAPLADFWSIRATFTADAFGYGERVSLDPLTVTQSLTGTNPLRVDLPTIHGDAPAALRIEVAGSTDVTPVDGAPGSRFLVACLSGPADTDLAALDIGTGDGASVWDSSADPVTDADFYGGSYRPLTIAAATALADAPWLARTFDGLPRGRYQAWVRNDRDAAGQSYLLRLDVSGIAGSWVLATSGSEAVSEGWSCLGEYQFPLGTLLPDDLDLPAPGDGETLKLYAATPDAAAGEVRVDAIAFIPVDVLGGATTALQMESGGFPHYGEGVSWTADGGAGSGLVWFAQADAVLSQPSVTLVGGFPVADPAAERNVLVVMPIDAGHGADLTDPLTRVGMEYVVTVSYHPRLLHLDGRP